MLEGGLRVEYRFLGSAHTAEDEISAYIPGPVFPELQEIDATGIGAAMKDVVHAAFAVDSGENSTDDRVAFVQVLLQPGDDIIRERFYHYFSSLTGVVDGGHLPLRDAFQYPDAPSFLRLAAEFGGSEYRRILWRLDVFEWPHVWITVRGAAYATGIEQEVVIIIASEYRTG